MNRPCAALLGMWVAVMAATGAVNWTPRIVRRLVARSAALLPGAWQGQFGSGLRSVRRAAIALGDDADGRLDRKSVV